MESAGVWSSALVVLGALVIIAFERRYPYKPGQALFRKGFVLDVVWFSIAFSYLQGLLVFGWIIPAMDRVSHLSSRQLMKGWPLWAQLLFFLLTHDLFIFTFHRMMHSSKYLWRIHEAHHSGREVDFASGSRAHIIEAIITGTAEFAPIVLLGAAPEVALIKGVIDAWWGMWIHSNIDVRMGRWQFVINGPEMHRWHHSRDVHNINFATKFAFWDWICKTAYLPKDKKPARYGTEDVFPDNIITQQLFAFRPFTKPEESLAAKPFHPPLAQTAE